MILSCPNCATQYKVNEAAIGLRGRTVRCTACKTTWHAETPIDLRYSEGRAKDELELKEEAPKTKEELFQVKAKKLPGKYRAMLEDKKRLRALAIEGMVWGGLAAVAIATFVLAYVLRVDIVKAFPRIAGAYAMVGLKVNPTHLQFEKHTAEVAFKGGRFVVTVKAQIKNLSNKAVPVPPVRVTLYDSTQNPFDSVLMPPGDLMVAPHAVQTLTFDVADPRNLVSTLDLKFDLEAMNAMKSGKGLKGGHGKEDGHGEAAGHGDEVGHDAPAEHAEAAGDHATPAAGHGHDAPADAHGAPAAGAEGHAAQAPDAHAVDPHGAPAAPLATQPAPALRLAQPTSAHSLAPAKKTESHAPAATGHH
ncbi:MULTISPECIES: MJ0042-type zinc finger domain-containing protein [Asticcacaulis]|uniref:MJ0042-type zinc finger domain-containing protein n=1 Tax=Asticcacaulis TaxID=76890 RepID=UPI001FD9B002|nr:MULTISPECIES: MJ0042-type zinc finger domain-containing protein [Asticcacaulis]